jgi:para-nitrobenzyl esterase
MAAANKAAIPGMPRGGEFAPVVDGKIIPNHPFDPVAAPTASDVPLLIGTNKDEMTFMLMRDPLFGKYDHDTMRQRILAALASKKTDNMQKEGIESLLKTYSRTRPGATPHDILIAINSDRMRVGSIRLAERKVSGGPAPVFMYLFTWESPALNGMLKSCHTLEIPFVFNNMEPIGILGDSPERFSLAKRMSAAWVEFARKGDPNHEGIPLWQPYSPSKRSTMIFNTFCREEVDPNGEERKAWEGIL